MWSSNKNFESQFELHMPKGKRIIDLQVLNLLDSASGVKKLDKDMITKKKFGLRTLILAMLLVSMLFIPASSAKPLTEKITEKAVEEIEYNVPEPEPIITLNTTAKLPYWYLLEADENQQKSSLVILTIAMFPMKRRKK